MKLKKYKLIFILVVLMTGLSITGWAISTHYDHTFTPGEFQKELQNDGQIGNPLSGKLANNSPILFLISTGLIGLVGVRRHRKNMGAFQSKDKI
jgi:hypothetical protein